MYGMVNLAIQGFISERYGDSAWEEVKARAAPAIAQFLTMEQYPDELTQGLMMAASEITGDSMQDFMDSIGEYFVEFTRHSGYGELLQLIGTTLPEALGNLDNMHARVGLSFPELRPPTFWCTDVDDHSLVLHYQSVREGLGLMIPGTVRGLAAMLNTTATVEWIARREEGADHDQFLVRFGMEKQE
jgi:hypothetical protein